jgi:hypothetical protein
MKYATFGADGQINGRYDSDIHTAGQIPPTAVELSDDLFLRTINETDGVWLLSNGAVVKTAAVPQPPQVPTRVQMAQARLALLQQGYLDQVNSILAGLTGDAGKAAQIEWNFRQYVDRNNHLVQAIKTQLPLTEQQLDDLFALASTL